VAFDASDTRLEGRCATPELPLISVLPPIIADSPAAS
jgi:hypothetical protein